MYYVTLKHIPTGELQVCPMKGDWDYDAEYLWSEGNWSCDCNRLYEFREAKGLPRMPDEPSTGYCKGGKEYTVVSIKTHDGRVIVGEPSADYV